jgi:hypothetical protein
VTVHGTVRALCSEPARPCCDALVSPFEDVSAAGAGGRGGPRTLGRALRCTLRHRRDAGIAVGLAAATPSAMQDTLDRSLIALLRASTDHHRRRCLAPGGRKIEERNPCER